MIFELRNVTYEAAGQRIVNGVSWAVERGEHWTVLGPNGAGKTTLLKLACGYVWPNAGGEIYRQGELLTDLRALRRSIGWVTSSLIGQIPPRQRVLETVVAGKFAQTALVEMDWERPTADDFRRAEVRLDELGCADHRGKPFGVLSQGEQQKVLLARAQMAEPMLLVLDEPCAGLDPGAREQFLAATDALAARLTHLSLVLVTHHLEEITPAFRHLLALRDGRILYQGETGEHVDERLIQTLYGTKVRKLIRESGRIWPIW